MQLHIKWMKIQNYRSIIALKRDKNIKPVFGSLCQLIIKSTTSCLQAINRGKY